MSHMGGPNSVPKAGSKGPFKTAVPTGKVMAGHKADLKAGQTLHNKGASGSTGNAFCDNMNKQAGASKMQKAQAGIGAVKQNIKDNKLSTKTFTKGQVMGKKGM